ncbi:site-specific integrase [Bacillus cereus]|nr:site-specific integrase [Bacillus cereus]
MNGLRVKKASNGKSLRYLIVEDGIPIPDVCLWLDLMSMNSYLTGERYAYSMLRYLRYLKEIGIHYKEVTKKGVIEEYVKNLLGMRGVVVSIESPITFSALKLNIGVLKSFYYWLEDNEKIERNPIVYGRKKINNREVVETKFLYGQIWEMDTEKTILNKIKHKENRNHLKWYTQQEVKAIINQLPTLRDQLVFRISIETGMRIGEILGLKLEHFDPFDNWLKVIKETNIENQARAKTVEREIPIHENLVDNIQIYKENDRREADVEYSNYLFLNYKGRYKGRPLKTRNFLNILKDAAEKAGLDRKEIRTHSGRSTRAQELVEIMRDKPEVGVTEALIKEEMGWTSINTLKVYEKGYSKKQRKKIMEKIREIGAKFDV